VTSLLLAALLQAASDPLAAGLAASRDGRFEEAVGLLQQATAEAPRYEGWVALAVAQARLGRAAEARQAVDRALALDPSRPEAFVESGGLYFLEQRYQAAVDDFGRALIRREDDYARRMRATALQLLGRSDEALEDWNRLGEPRLQGLDVSGLRHTRSRVVQRELTVREGEMITRAQLRESRLRLREVGVFSLARLRPVPRGDGTAGLDAAFVERHGFGDPFALGAVIAGDAVRHQARLSYTNVAGAGIVVWAYGRWEDTQPRVALGVSWPRPFGLPFNLRAEGEMGRPQFDLGGDPFRLRVQGVDLRARRVVGSRTVGELGFLTRRRDWSVDTPQTPSGRLAGLTARLEHRLLDRRRHRLEALADGLQSSELLGSEVPATRGAVGLRYHGLVAGRDLDEPLAGSAVAVRLLAGAGASDVPLDLMFAPGAGSEMLFPLRAHRQKDHGVLGAAPIGPRMVLLNAEWRQRVLRKSFLELGLVALLDSVRMRDTAQGATRVSLDDAGVGLRLILSGVVFRLDYARSVSGDHASTWTAGLGHAF
jgi:tetratricopeptide repeat protein